MKKIKFKMKKIEFKMKKIFEPRLAIERLRLAKAQFS